MMIQNPNDDDFDFLNDDFGLDEESDRTVEPVARELLTLKLLREAIQAQKSWRYCHAGFCRNRIAQSAEVHRGASPAKGGKFFAEYLDRVVNPQRIAAGKKTRFVATMRLTNRSTLTC